MDDPVSIIKYGKVSCLSLTVTNKRIKKNTFTKKERSAINLNFCNPEKNQSIFENENKSPIPPTK